MKQAHSRIIVFLALLFSAESALAAITMRPANPNYLNEVGIGISYGWKLDKDAEFVGFAPDYTRVFANRWVLNLSVAYDRETERKSGFESDTESWTPSVVLGYQLNNRWAIGAGLGHGLYQTDESGNWKTVNWGDDLSAALATAVTLWNQDRHAVSLSMAYEYGFSDDEPSISMDLGYGFGF